MDKRFIFLVLILVAFGLIILFSAGTVDAQKKFGSSYFYLKHQFLAGVLPGLFLFFLFSKIDYRRWKKISLLFLFASLFLMVMVFVPKFGLGIRGASRWITLGTFTFQPAELLKLALVIYLAAWFGGKGERIRSPLYGTVPFILVLAFVAMLLIMQPDIGTLIVVSLTAIIIYILAGVSMRQVVIVGLAAVILFSIIVVVEPYRLDRIKAYLNPSLDQRGISYQINQSLISIGSGGLFGVGYGKSTQKLGFLPEVINDSIFAVVAEELGYVGVAVLILLFLALSFTMTQIAKETSDKFGMLLVMGMNGWIMSQALVNISAICGLIPLTGIPLPFVSYGGTALMSLLAGLGIVYNVAKRA